MAQRWFRSASIWTTALLVLVPLVCGIVILGEHAPRDWSLHWRAPTTVVANASVSNPENSHAVVSTPQGWDLLWIKPHGGMALSRFNWAGHRLGPDTAIKGTPQSVTLTRVGSSDVAVWTQDLPHGSELRSAVVKPNAGPVYTSLVRGKWVMEHPQAFPMGKVAGVVFSWQRGAFNVYLTHVDPSRHTVQPVALTHLNSYAFNPHAAADGTGAVRLLYMGQCCGQNSFHVLSQRFSSTGRPLSSAKILDTVSSMSGVGSSGTPENWGMDLRALGRDVWAAWMGDGGVTIAAWHGARATVPTHVAAITPPGWLTIALSPQHRELVWEQPFDLGTQLSTLSINPQGLPLGQPDRVAYEPASAAQPFAVTLGPTPAVVWEATPSGEDVTRIEISHYSTREIGAPSLWARLGLGLANPLGNLALLIVGAVAVGALLTAGNILLVMALVALFYVLKRAVAGPLRWYAYAAVLAIIFFLLMVNLHAPFPPVILMSSFPFVSGLVAAVGALFFVILLTRSVLRRAEDLYRAGAMALAVTYFFAFLQALTILQGQIAKI